MKQNFEECMARLLEHEGGYVWHAQDPGGETNFGVTRANLRTICWTPGYGWRNGRSNPR